MKPADLIEDAEYLVLAGEWPERAARRLGYRNFRSLEKRLYTLGRHDLVSQMRLLDHMSLAYQLAHNTPMDEVVARDKKHQKQKRSTAA